MNGVHDLGGMHGFGPVEREANEPPFHAAWERTVNGVNVALRGAGLYNIDEFRHGIERMDPAEYLASSYYERWLDGIARVLVEKGVVGEAELAARTALFDENPVAPMPPPAASSLQPPPRAERQHPFRREVATLPRFAPGDAVLARNVQPLGHTRLPRYVRGKRGVIDRLHGAFVFPDTNAHGQGEQPQPLYSVRFEGHELWGESADVRETLYIDLWESYLTSDS